MLGVKYMYLLYFLLVFFAVLGLISFIKGLATSFLRVEDTCCSTNLLITINNSQKNCIEFETKIALSRLRWYNIKRFDKVYVVGKKLNDENYRLCSELCNEFDVELLDLEKFSDKISE